MSIRSDTAALRNMLMESPSSGSGFPSASGSGEPLAGPIGGNISNGLAFDIADQLPPAARARLEAWRDEKADRHAALRNVTDTLDDLRLSLATARTNEKNRLDYPNTLNPDDVDKVLAHYRAIVEQAEQRFARAQTKADQRAEAWRYSANLVRDAEKYLGDCRGAAITDVPITAPKSLSVEAALEKLEALRAELAAVETAPRPSGEARRILRAQVEALAERGRPNVYRTVEHGEPARLPEAEIKITTYSTDGTTAGGGGRITDAVALVAWAFKDQLLARLEQELEASSDDGAALSDEERRVKLADLNTKVLAAERALVAVCDRDGINYPDPDNLDPRALLGVDGPAARG